jgi:tetratricopeptide (TPR) repeat protein
MSWLRRLFGGPSNAPPPPQRLDYVKEALALEHRGEFDAALTSYRLALRDRPDDATILQHMAIAYSKAHRLDEAIRCYRRALQAEPTLAGAHYGLAFLLLKDLNVDGARQHLQAFLAHPPTEPAAAAHVEHARETLRRLDTGARNVEDVPAPDTPHP